MISLKFNKNNVKVKINHLKGIDNQHLKMKSALIEMWLCQLLGEILMALALTGVVNQCLTWVLLSEFPEKE